MEFTVQLGFLLCSNLFLVAPVTTLVIPDEDTTPPNRARSFQTENDSDTEYVPDPKLPDFTPECLQCICQASSGCNENLQCKTISSGSLLCGRYYMTLNYWKDAGQFGPSLDARQTTNAFRTCATNKDCADKTVTAYMRRYVEDCDQDGEITCFDYARIHLAGPSGCSRNTMLTSIFWKNFQKCYAYAPDLDPRKILDHRGNV